MAVTLDRIKVETDAVELNLSSSKITSLTNTVNGKPLIHLLSSLPKLNILNLSSNKIKSLFPLDIPSNTYNKICLRNILSFNLSDNPIADIKKTVETILVLLPELTDLQISLFDESHVSYIISKLPKLKYLNNLQIERPETNQSFAGTEQKST